MVKRIELLGCLELLTPGLAKKELIEQSACFVFRDGLAQTFNDEVACSMKADYGIEGAVPAEPLLNLLRQLPDENIKLGMGVEEGSRRSFRGSEDRLRVLQSG